MTIFDFHPPTWHQYASCAQIGIGMADEFFPDKGQRSAEVVAICGGCPVRDLCLQQAIDADERFGYWGGLSAHERDVITGRRAS